jgi:hypothetical protein
MLQREQMSVIEKGLAQINLPDCRIVRREIDILQSNDIDFDQHERQAQFLPLIGNLRLRALSTAQLISFLAWDLAGMASR